MLDTNNTNAEGSQYPAYWKLCIVRTPEVVRVNKLMQVNIGQGEGETKWKGCPWKALRLKFDNLYKIISKNTKKNKLILLYYSISMKKQNSVNHPI